MRHEAWSKSVRTQIFGVDFSGAVDAGNRLWVAHGILKAGGLRVESCARGRSLPGAGRGRDQCLTALREMIAGSGRAALGLDFPFGLPEALVPQRKWVDFVLDFESIYGSPEAFRRDCRLRAKQAELKRATDREARTPFSPYNLRLYRQTYYGIAKVLGPLAKKAAVSVLPMQRAEPDRPWLLEICPASTLKRLGLYVPYKGRGVAFRAGRGRILSLLKESGGLTLADGVLRAVILEDAGGDALDSVLAAWATAKALGDVSRLAVPAASVYAKEGYVYA